MIHIWLKYGFTHCRNIFQANEIHRTYSFEATACTTGMLPNHADSLSTSHKIRYDKIRSVLLSCVFIALTIKHWNAL